VTIGEFIAAVRQESIIYPKTIESYAQALRKIAGDIVEKESDRDAIKLRSLTPEKIEAWRDSFIRRKAINPVAEKSARVSANSFISRARALFGQEVVARIKDSVELPETLPFAGVKVERVRVPRYRSTFDIATLLEQAPAELPTEQLKIFLLAAMAGLRRNESTSFPGVPFAGMKVSFASKPPNSFGPRVMTRKPMSWLMQNCLNCFVASMPGARRSL
jgi:hypothetical protein